jgi:uncharacterized ion transporter superfamily protein YfcC
MAKMLVMCKKICIIFSAFVAKKIKEEPEKTLLFFERFFCKRGIK